MQRLLPSLMLTGTLLTTLLAAPSLASQEDVKRELERLKLPADTLSATPVLLPRPPRSSVPGESAAVTILAPLGAIAIGSSFGYVGTAFGALAAPLTMGAGHFHAGDPLRGTLISLGGPAVMLTSFMGFGLVGEKIEDPSIRHLRGWATGLLGSLAVTIGYWLWAANDAAETARRKQDEATRLAPAAPR